MAVSHEGMLVFLFAVSHNVGIVSIGCFCRTYPRFQRPLSFWRFYTPAATLTSWAFPPNYSARGNFPEWPQPAKGCGVRDPVSAATKRGSECFDVTATLCTLSEDTDDHTHSPGKVSIPNFYGMVRQERAPRHAFHEEVVVFRHR